MTKLLVKVPLLPAMNWLKIWLKNHMYTETVFMLYMLRRNHLLLHCINYFKTLKKKKKTVHVWSKLVLMFYMHFLFIPDLVNSSYEPMTLFFFFLMSNFFVWVYRQVSTEEGEAKARELNVMFIEASAKAGFNIKVLHLFLSLYLFWGKIFFRHKSSINWLSIKMDNN